MSVFGKPQFPEHLKALKERVNKRDTESELKLERAWIDYHDRLTQAENKVVGDFDKHAMEAEAAMKELSNRGEEITAAVSNASGAADTKAETTEVSSADVKPFPNAAE